jgi:hypothetical protein
MQHQRSRWRVAKMTAAFDQRLSRESEGRYRAVPAEDYTHWTVQDNGQPCFGPLSEIEAKAIAREMNTQPGNPWS